ncbi:MAG: hypothetical protein IKO85_02380 [Bacteroidaceae bacterium]|nr:hypothetical protein [Bacteroidaceae bacterium]
MKRYIPIFLWLLCTLVQAQDAYVIHYKDGSTQRIPHGIYPGNLSFWGDASGEQGLSALRNQAGQPGYAQGLSLVTDYAKDDAQPTHYSIFIALKSEAPTTRPLEFCLGRQSGVSLEQCDTVLTFQLPDNSLSNLWNNVLAFGDFNKAPTLHGTETPWHGPALHQWLSDLKYHCLPLAHGQTYYYRTFARIPILQSDGRRDTIVAYGPELSFRIPDLAEEGGAVPPEVVQKELNLPSVEAWRQFLDSNFPDHAGLTSHQGVCELWAEWLQTDEGRTSAAALPTTLHEYDDARVTFCSSVPTEFAAWMRQHEIVWSKPEDFLVQTVGVRPHDDYKSAPATIIEQVDDTDSDWGNPVDSYLRFLPTTPDGYSQQVVAAKAFVPLHKVVPGVSYRLNITFAPETDTLNYQALPTPMSIAHWSQDYGYVFEQDVPEKTQLYSNKGSDAISATEPTTLTFDLAPNALLGRILHVGSNVTPVSIRLRNQSGVFRIAEVRLTPTD